MYSLEYLSLVQTILNDSSFATFSQEHEGYKDLIVQGVLTQTKAHIEEQFTQLSKGSQYLHLQNDGNDLHKGVTGVVLEVKSLIQGLKDDIEQDGLTEVHRQELIKVFEVLESFKVLTADYVKLQETCQKVIPN